MSPFVARFGYVRYYPGIRNARWFPKVTGPCEITGCERMRAEQEMCANLAQFKGMLSDRSFRERSGASIEWESVDTDYYAVDHCHRHGYIRGIICGTCNNLMKEYDRRGFHGPSDYELKHWNIGITGFLDNGLIRKLGLNDYADNCPECAGTGLPAAA